MFADDAWGAKELSANVPRIEGWRRTLSYQYLLVVCRILKTSATVCMNGILTLIIKDFAKVRATQAIQGFDVLHQFYRLRYTKNIPNAEVELIMRALADNLQSYEQVVEVS